MSPSPSPPRWPAALVVLLAVLVVAGAAALWPSERPRPATGQVVDTERGEVVAVRAVRCTTPNATGCRAVRVRIDSGPDRGEEIEVRVGEAVAEPRPDVGDVLRLTPNQRPGDPPVAGLAPYTVSDFERRAPLGWLAAAFVLAVLLLGRVRGARALVGLAASVAIVFLFVVPAVLDGRPPAAVALVGSLGIMLVTVAVTHGAGVLTLSAVLGTSASLALTIALGASFVELAHLTGLSSDPASLLLAGRPDLSLEGIVLAGLVIGALGVLDDVTVSQASTVLALRRADPRQGWRALYRNALRVGQDHSTATVNTLVLAYVGASLPVLLIFSSSGISVGDALNSEPVATEVVAMLAGSIGLLAAVPLTTGLTAWLACRLAPGVLPEGHGHVH